MIFEPESGRARYKKILDSGSGSGTHWALIATLPCFRLVNCLRRKGCPYDRASTLFIFITIIITIIIIARPKPAYDRQGLAAVSLRASGAQLGRGKWSFFVTNKHTLHHNIYIIHSSSYYHLRLGSARGADQQKEQQSHDSHPRLLGSPPYPIFIQQLLTDKWISMHWNHKKKV